MRWLKRWTRCGEWHPHFAVRCLKTRRHCSLHLAVTPEGQRTEWES